MTDLIRRLEEAKEGSRVLDRDIFLAVNPDWLERGLYAGVDDIPHYTTNLQDAVSAVPEAMNWDVSGGHPTHVWATIWNDGCTTAENLYQVPGATPALALCIAILRAMEAKNE